MQQTEIEMILRKIETVSSQEIDQWVDRYEEVIDTLPETEIEKYESLYDSILLKRMTNIWSVVADTEQLIHKPIDPVTTKSKSLLYTLFLSLLKWGKHPARYTC